MNVGIVAPQGYPHWRVFEDLAFCLARSSGDGFTALSHDCSALDGQWLILGANTLHMDPAIRLPDNAILFNLEQYSGRGWFTPDYLALLRSHCVWDYSQANIEWLATQGIKAELCRVGYHPCLTRIAPAIEDIDVLFYGSGTTRRHQVIPALAAEGINIEWAFDCYGQTRDDLIARAKLVLNLHAWEQVPPLEMVRLQLLFANRKCVVSEACLPDDPDWQDYRDCLVTIDADRPTDAAFVIKGLLADAETRTRIGNLAFETFSTRLQKDFMPCAIPA